MTFWSISQAIARATGYWTFARRPAPVQVTYLLGQCDCQHRHVGYGRIHFADTHLAFPLARDCFVQRERLIRLSRIPLAYAPPDGMPPVTALPALSNGHVTFGHFGRTERLNDMVIATWAHILHAVPSSRLVLDNKPFQEAAFREMFLARFAREGIEPARLDLVYSAPQPKQMGPPMAASTSPWIRFPTMRAQRPSRRCGRVSQSYHLQGGRQSVGSVQASCTRLGWKIG